MVQVAIIGGGLAGIVNAIQLASQGIEVVLIEQKSYPFHKVCGEYVSNETLPFLASLGFHPTESGASNITQLEVTAPSGNSINTKLDLGGFGLSRYVFDHTLVQLAKNQGAQILEKVKVRDIQFEGDHFSLDLTNGTSLKAEIVIGAFGKRANIDRILDRDFFRKESPYVGVKYHMELDLPNDTIFLHNFENGYCGIVKIEGNRYCVCYLVKRKMLREAGSVEQMEEDVLYKNKFVKRALTDGKHLYEKPEVINEISFATKSPVEDHILMAGDAAGMITPLCGNGMAMAIHSAKILSSLTTKYFRENMSREDLEEVYRKEWNAQFASRLRTGRIIQNLFGRNYLSEAAVRTLKPFPFITNQLIRATHGKPF